MYKDIPFEAIYLFFMNENTFLSQYLPF